MNENLVPNPSDPIWRDLCRIGGVSALVLIAYSLATMVQLVVLGGQPATAAEAFRLLRTNRALGLLRLDLPTVFAMPLYYLLFAGLFAALRRVGGAYTLAAAGSAFVGVTLLLATPMGLSMLSLSDKYAAATTDEARQQLLAAGEAILATDMWHGTGAILGGIFLETGALLISLLMLRSSVFSKPTAYVGIVTHGLDLIHAILGPVTTRGAFVLMAIAGPLYLVWFALVGRTLRRLGRGAELS
jgi:hypothetical protein